MKSISIDSKPVSKIVINGGVFFDKQLATAQPLRTKDDKNFLANDKVFLVRKPS